MIPGIAFFWLIGGATGGEAVLAASTVYIVLAMLPVTGLLFPAGRVKRRLVAAGNIWFGFFIYFAMLVIPVAAVAFASGAEPGGTFVAAALSIPVLGSLVINIYGFHHANDLRVTRYRIETEKDLGERKELKIVFASDLHIGANSRESLYRRMTEKINAEKPDLVLFGGDYFNSSSGEAKDLRQMADLISGIDCPGGVCGVWGNHDAEGRLFCGFSVGERGEEVRLPEMTRFMRYSGVVMLEDESIGIQGIVLIGRKDGEITGDGTERKTFASLAEDTDRSKFIVVLQHEPTELDLLSEAGADVVLSGHTHGGQIFPGSLVIPFFNEDAYGMKKRGDMTSIVSSGVGFFGPPIRTGSRAEIVSLTVSGRDAS